MNFFDHKDLGNHLLQLCPKVVKRPVYASYWYSKVIITDKHKFRLLQGTQYFNAVTPCNLLDG